MKIWELEDGSKNPELTALVEEFTAGQDVDYDGKLKNYDILGSIAHVAGLESINILTGEEAGKLKTELAELLDRDLDLTAADEDVHTKVEMVITERLGELGKKLHTGRSRNDQVLVDLRLFEKNKIMEIVDKLLNLAENLVNFANRHHNTPMVGYTHTRRAMPSSVGLWASSYAQALLDDLVPIESAYTLINQSPLGVGAGYGVPLSLDREMTAELLGFKKPLDNAVNAMNSRGKYELQLLGALAGVQLDLSRLSSDLVAFSEKSYDYFEIPDEFTTGSSIMPQKKNPDVLELIRGKTSTFHGHLTSLYSLISGLRSGYSRDLQETKPPLFEGAKITAECLAVTAPLIENLSVNESNLLSHFTEKVFATDKALQLVEEGLPFRRAYGQVKSDLLEGQEKEPVSRERINEALARRDHSGGPGKLQLAKMEEEIDAQRKIWAGRREEFRAALEDLADVE